MAGDSKSPLSENVEDRKSAEERLRANEARYRRIFEKSGAASIIIDPDMTIVMSNEEFEKLTGYAKAEIENKMKWSAVVAPEDLARMSAYHYRRREPGGEAPEEYECRIVNRNGELRDIFIKVGMLPDGRQSIASFMDITALKKREEVRLKSSIRDRFRFGGIIGRSPAMQQVYEAILHAAAADANVVVYGESGTGKELVARAIHDNSDRKEEAFVVVNCGAVPETLLESEFFGYRKGAFTGADRHKHGYLDLADNGTLFLDELGEIGAHMQVKLLRVVEGRGFTPVGGDRVSLPNIRIIAATNRDLSEQVRIGRMRADFFYRIHVIPIHLPPLRERKEDIPLLIEHFMQAVSGRRNVPPVTGRMLDTAQAYDWPGNIRELQNVLHRYVTFNRFDLPERVPARSVARPATGRATKTGDREESLAASVAAFEKQQVMDALERHQWHRGRAAEYLGIHRRTLFKKMRRYGLHSTQNRNDRS